MAKLLTYVQVQQEKLNQRWGWPTDFGQYVVRVANILGVKGFVKQHTDGSWFALDVPSVIGAIHGELAEVREAVTA